jgi:hypothetical protein
VFLRTEEKKREQAKEKQRNDAAPVATAAPIPAPAQLKDVSNVPAIEATAPAAVQQNGRESPPKETSETTEGQLEKSSTEDINVTAAQDDQVCLAEEVA